MDGFEMQDQVIVIAATNRSDVLDPALTDLVRFDTVQSDARMRRAAERVQASLR